MKYYKIYFIYLFFLPILSIVGSIYTSYGNSIISLITITSILVIFLISIFTSIIKGEYYPFVIFSISLSLLFQTAFLSDYIVGYDMNVEYFVYRNTIDNNLWSNIFSSNQNVLNYNSMLSVTILPTIINIITGMEGTDIFKVLYPILFSFTSIMLYLSYNLIFNKKISLICAFLFMSPFSFSSIEMLSLGKQMIAMLIFSMLIYLILNENIDAGTKKVVFIFLSFAEIISHYSTSYIYIIFTIIYYLYQRVIMKKKEKEMINIMYVILIISMIFAWYSSEITRSSPLNSALKTIIKIIEASPQESFIGYIPNIMFGSVLRSLGAIIFYLVQGMIFFGFIYITKKHRSYSNYYPVSLASMAIMISAVVIPRLGRSLVITRFYQISMMFLTPLYILGFKWFSERLLKINTYKNHIVSSCIIIIFFMFQIGFIYEIAGDTSGLTRKGLSMHRIDDELLYYGITNDQDVFSAAWLSQLISEEMKTYVYADDVATSNVLASYGLFPPNNKNVIKNITEITNGYIFLTTFNIKYNKLIVDKSVHVRFGENFDKWIFVEKNLIFANGGNIYFVLH